MDVASLLVKLGISADTKPLEKIEHRLDSLNSKLRFLAGAEVVRALYHLTEGFGHSSLELLNTASAAGLTTEAMQGLQYAVTQAGGNAGELGMTMTHIAREMQGARLGAEDALQTFYQLGISQQQVASFHTTEDALYGIMDALQKIQDPIRRQALMDRALGQGSRALGRFALAGRGAAAASKQLAQRLGVNIPNATLLKLADARNATMSIGLVFKSVTAQIAGGFAPAIVQAVHGLQEFYIVNKKMIDVGVGKFIEHATFGFGELYAVVYIVARAFTNFIHKHQKLVELTLDWAPALLANASAIPLITTALRVFNTVGGLALAIVTGITAETLGFTVAIGVAVATLGLFLTSLFSIGQVIRDHGMKGLLDPKNFEGTAIFKTLDAMKESVTTAKEIGKTLQGVWAEFGDQPGLLGGAFANLGGALQGQSTPPASIAMPLSPVANNTSYAPQVTNNFAVNVPPGMTADQAKGLITQSVRDAQQLSMEQAMRRQATPFHY